MLRTTALLALFLLVAQTPSCRRSPNAPLDSATGSTAEQEIVRGVVFRRLDAGNRPGLDSPVSLLDADLGVPGVRARVVAGPVRVRGRRAYAVSRYVLDWCRLNGAIGGVNGGFFGASQGASKEVVGLLATEGTVRSSGRLVRSRTNPELRFARSVLGFDSKGTPRIGWAVAERGREAILTDYAAPQNPEAQCYWSADSAVACGPRIAKAGQPLITDRAERLVSPPAVARTFAAYDIVNGRPRHLVLGIALQMTFYDVCTFLESYFGRYHRTKCAEAMCLDGGSSSQLAYRTPTGYEDARPTPVTVPTAVIVEVRP